MPRRVFYALWPAAAARRATLAATAAAVESSQGRAVGPAKIHMTVAFIGEVDTERFARAAAVSAPRVGALELTLDTLVYHRRSRMLWLVPSTPPTVLAELERELWERLEDQGFERERRPFRPHVTLARRARPVEAEVAPVVWTIEQLTLVESCTRERESRYVPVATWPL